MKLNIHKSKVPILWIDTFVIIGFAKILKGENIQEIDKTRFTYLHRFLQDKVKEKKLICVYSEQIEEIKLGKRLVEECSDVLIRLSLGVRTKGSYSIEHLQQYKFMKAFFNSQEEIDINYSEAFFEDPIKKLKSNDQFIIAIKETVNDENIKAAEERKNQLIEELEQLRLERVSRGINYEEQVKIEATGIIQAMNEYMARLRSGYKTFDLNEYMAIIGDSLRTWSKISGVEGDIPGLLNFFKSTYYSVMPYNAISSQLFA